jgi:Dyp-type peroxidase family
MKPNESSKHLQGITDLTLVAPIGQELVHALDTRTCETRVKLLMKTLNSLRSSSREFAPIRPFSDTVERIQAIHSFRLAILEPEKKLLLAVTFDGAWEPYIRLIWRDLGTLLDVIFCNCDGYKSAFHHGFDEYAAWIRSCQVDSGFFYNDSGLTIGDLSYLRQSESLQRRTPASDTYDLAAATLLIEDPEQAAQTARKDVDRTKKLGLSALAALYRLTSLYPADRPDGDYLLRATHELLKEFDTKALFPAGSDVRDSLFTAQLEWFERPRQDRAPAKPDRLKYRNEDIQGGILTSYPNITHGCLVLIGVTSAVQGRQFLEWLRPQVSTEGAQPEQGIFLNVVLTLQGLRRLGVPERELEAFPKEFREGMEARADLLGDFRGNHPRNWNLPERNWPNREVDGGIVERVELSSVDIVVQLRIQGDPKDDNDEVNANHPLYPKVTELAGRAGVKVLSVEAMRRYQNDAGAGVEHFGFADGISQPVVAEKPAGTYWDDRVSRGEILCGYANDRNDDPLSAEDGAYLDNGTFLVVRKLRQDVKTLHVVLDGQTAGAALSRDDLKAKMMGRKTDGTPLADAGLGATANDFNYEADRDGAKCPFQAHIRRANPRTKIPGKPDPRVIPPRIMRRGMSYGPRYNESEQEGVERGLVFMAYNASIAEQYEVIQRWIIGANSSGVFSGQSDPLLGVPQRGDARTFRFREGNRVVRLGLDDPTATTCRPFVELQWGAYFFVPSLAVLKKIAEASCPMSADPAHEGEVIIQRLLAMERRRIPREDLVAAWKTQLEDAEALDSGATAAIWAAVRQYHDGVLGTPYGVLVAGKKLVMQVFLNADDRYSVCGYMHRMKQTIGDIYLGLDQGNQYNDESLETNKAIMSITAPEAFVSARNNTSGFLDLALGAAHPRSEGTMFDTGMLSDFVLAGLSNEWFGLPDNKYVAAGGWDWVPGRAPRCPGHFTSPSRYLFSPNPGSAVKDYAVAHGESLQKAVSDFVAYCRNNPVALEGHRLSKAMFDAISDNTRLVHTIIGAMMGFLPTLDGNLRSTLYEWMKDKSLWLLQEELASSPIKDDFERATFILAKPLMRTMQRRPVPDMVWRTAVKPHHLGKVKVNAGDKIIVGIVSATQEDLARNRTDVDPVFGGDRSETPAPTHACPAYKAAMGTLLGIISALLEAGTLRPTPSPTAIILIASGRFVTDAAATARVKALMNVKMNR